MPRFQTIVVAEIAGRPDWEDPQFGITYAKHHRKYVHGKPGMAKVMHKVRRVQLRWWTGDYRKMLRLASPHMIAETVCGTSFFLEAGRAGMCDEPKPGAVLCGMCHGTGRNFPRNTKPPVTVQQARDRLGCREGAVCAELPAWDGEVFRG